MTEADRTKFEQAFCKRVQALRKAHGYSQSQMATMLGVPDERYKKYENRSPMPVYLIPRFALITGKPIAFVLTGKDDPRSESSSVVRLHQAG